MSIDRLETRLRQSGISSIEDVRYGSIEVSGQLGYELKQEKQPMTKEDFNFLMNEISEIKLRLGMEKAKQVKNDNEWNIFEEINAKNFEGNKKEP